jgi:hypothetical protein
MSVEFFLKKIILFCCCFVICFDDVVVVVFCCFCVVVVLILLLFFVAPRRCVSLTTLISPLSPSAVITAAYVTFQFHILSIPRRSQWQIAWPSNKGC